MTKVELNKLQQLHTDMKINSKRREEKALKKYEIYDVNKKFYIK